MKILIILVFSLFIMGCATNTFIKQYDDLRSDYDSGKITEQEFRTAYNNLQSQATTYYQNQEIENRRLAFIVAKSISESCKEMQENNQRAYQEYRDNLRTNRLINAIESSKSYRSYSPTSSHTSCHYIGDYLYCNTNNY